MKLLCDLGLLKVILNAYAQKSSEKERLIDIFLLFTVFVFLAVVGNYIVLGEFPYNAFLGAIFCCLGIFSATLALRVRISSLESRWPKENTAKRCLFDEKCFRRICFIVFVIFSVCISHPCATHYFAANLKRTGSFTCMCVFILKSFRYICRCAQWKSKNFYA